MSQHNDAVGLAVTGRRGGSVEGEEALGTRQNVPAVAGRGLLQAHAQAGGEGVSPHHRREEAVRQPLPDDEPRLRDLYERLSRTAGYSWSSTSRRRPAPRQWRRLKRRHHRGLPARAPRRGAGTRQRQDRRRRLSHARHAIVRTQADPAFDGREVVVMGGACDVPARPMRSHPRWALQRNSATLLHA